MRSSEFSIVEPSAKKRVDYINVNAIMVGSIYSQISDNVIGLVESGLSTRRSFLPCAGCGSGMLTGVVFFAAHEPNFSKACAPFLPSGSLPTGSRIKLGRRIVRVVKLSDVLARDRCEASLISASRAP